MKKNVYLLILSVLILTPKQGNAQINEKEIGAW